AEAPGAHSEVHLLPAAALPDTETHASGLKLVNLASLVVAKLSGFRLEDRVHIRDIDGVGLINSEIEAGLSPVLTERLADIRANRVGYVTPASARRPAHRRPACLRLRAPAVSAYPAPLPA